MSIIRVRKDARYFTASNEPFQDKRLSWETRGLMGYLLTEPNNYAVFMKNKETGYIVHGDYVLTKAEAQEIADALDKEWPDHTHYVKQEGEE